MATPSFRYTAFRWPHVPSLTAISPPTRSGLVRRVNEGVSSPPTTRRAPTWKHRGGTGSCSLRLERDMAGTRCRPAE